MVLKTNMERAERRPRHEATPRPDVRDSPSILDEGSKSSRSPLHTLRRHSKYELSRQFIACVVPLQNLISPTTIPPIGTGSTIRLFVPRNQCPTLQFRYCFCSCMELSFLQFAVGFVVNYKHSATIPNGNAMFQHVMNTERLSPSREAAPLHRQGDLKSVD